MPFAGSSFKILSSNDSPTGAAAPVGLVVNVKEWGILAWKDTLTGVLKAGTEREECLCKFINGLEDLSLQSACSLA